MPITLTTPHHDNPQVRIGVVGIDLRNHQIVLTVEYGDTDPGDAGDPEADPPVPSVAPSWVPNGEIAAVTHTIMNHELETDGEVELVAEDSVYNDLVSAARGIYTFTDKSADSDYVKVTITHPTHGDLDLWVELDYASVKRNLYQWLLDEEVYEGTIV